MRVIAPHNNQKPTILMLCSIGFSPLRMHLLFSRSREAARIFRESKITDKKINFFYFAKISLSVNKFRKKIYFEVPAIFFSG